MIDVPYHLKSVADRQSNLSPVLNTLPSCFNLGEYWLKIKKGQKYPSDKYFIIYSLNLHFLAKAAWNSQIKFQNRYKMKIFKGVLNGTSPNAWMPHQIWWLSLGPYSAKTYTVNILYWAWTIFGRNWQS